MPTAVYDIADNDWLDTGPVRTTWVRSYVESVARELGIGLESAVIDPGSPASAYLALDLRQPGTDNDLALLWDERHGWSLVVETNSLAELRTLSRLPDEAVPEPKVVAGFARHLGVTS
jgi:RIO-like serine/threonine protein kinase